MIAGLGSTLKGYTPLNLFEDKEPVSYPLYVDTVITDKSLGTDAKISSSSEQKTNLILVNESVQEDPTKTLDLNKLLPAGAISNSDTSTISNNISSVTPSNITLKDQAGTTLVETLKEQQELEAQQHEKKVYQDALMQQQANSKPSLNDALGMATPQQAYSAFVETWDLYKKSNPNMPALDKLPIPDLAKDNIDVLMKAVDMLTELPFIGEAQGQFMQDYHDALLKRIAQNPNLNQSQDKSSKTNWLLYGGVALLVYWLLKRNT